MMATLVVKRLISKGTSLTGFRFNSFANFSLNVCWDPESNKVLAIENLFS